MAQAIATHGHARQLDVDQLTGAIGHVACIGYRAANTYQIRQLERLPAERARAVTRIVCGLERVR